MGNLKGFESLGEKSKVESHKVIVDGSHGNFDLGRFGGKNPHKTMIGLKAKPTGHHAPTDGGDKPMVPSSRGGASGDGPTPGYDGSGAGQATLNGAHGRH